MSNIPKSPAPAATAGRPVAAESVPEPRPAVPSRLAAWLPALVALGLAPVATWAVVEFILVPRLQRQFAAGTEAVSSAVVAAPHGDKPRDPKARDQGPGYEFQNVVVNLAGTAGTRYLKTSFLVTGSDPNLRAAFEGARPRLMDVTLNVLSSLTLPDLEEPGARNIIREKLVGAYNQVLGRKVADQVYFSDFVIQ
jgi:flagellar protein FliL